MRAVYDTTMDIIDGPGTATPGNVRHVAVPCRLVVETIILPRNKFVIQRTHYVTTDQVDIHGGFIATTVPGQHTIDQTKADRLAIPTGAAAGYTVLWEEAITPTDGTPYIRANIRNSP